MRWALVRVAVAVSAMVAIAFLVPLAGTVQRAAEQAALARAQRAAAAVAPVLAVSQDPATIRQALTVGDGGTGRLAVDLPSGGRIGLSLAPAAALDRARRGQSAVVDVPNGRSLLQPVVLGTGEVVVIESFVPNQELHAGLTRSWAVLVVLALGLIAACGVVFDRLAGGLVRSTRDLARAARRFGSGDLAARVPPGGLHELGEVGLAFNGMADRMIALMERERELAAEVSHRLRTPLTAVRLNAARLRADPQAGPLLTSIDTLEYEVDRLIRGALVGHGSDHGSGCDATAVVRERLEFWSPLADDQARALNARLPDRPVLVSVSDEALGAGLDALLGNVFRHTPEGTSFEVALAEAQGQAVLEVVDEGPGIDATSPAADRTGRPGTTGLGLGIVRRLADDAGGGFAIGSGPLGGTRVRLSLPVRGREVSRARPRPSGRDPRGLVRRFRSL